LCAALPAATLCADVVVRGRRQGFKVVGRVEKLSGAIMAILRCRRSPARRGLGANAPQVLQRTAELIPNQLRFSAPPRLHPWELTCRIPFGAKPFYGSPSPKINLGDDEQHFEVP
jgi:hypothetical protein